MEAVPLDAIVGQSILNSVRHLVDQIAAFTRHFATIEWGGNHGSLLLVLTETKMWLAAGIQDLECGHTKRTELLNPKIEDETKGRGILQLQEDHKVNWQEYTFHEVIDAVALKDIVPSVNTQYVEQL